MAATVVPITTLSPTSAPPADAAIRAVVTLIWPYSSSTEQYALLLADPDFRLRNRKGQVRVRFSGPSAVAVALGSLGIGDEVLLELKGAAWAQRSDDTVRTPGKSVDGELSFAAEVGLQKAGGEWIRADRSRPSPMKEMLQTPVGQNRAKPNISRFGPGAFGGAVPIYSSPAFVRISHLSGGGFRDGYDPFTGEYEDIDAEGPRKRARVSFGGVGKWKLAGRTPTPEMEDQPIPQPGANADVNLELVEDVLMTEGSPDTNNPDKTISARISDFAQPPKMAPPTLSHLQMPDAPSNPIFGAQHFENGPSTPTLRPVPSSTLPLPSPFPAVPQVSNSSLGTHAAASLPATASTSQRSLALLQSLDDTADPDNEQSPTGIYAQSGAIEGIDREHVANPEYLSDTEEDENLYEEHMRNMREEGMRNEYDYNVHENDGVQEVDGDDVEEIIEDMGEEPDNSSDEDVDGSEARKSSRAPSVVDIDDDELGNIDRLNATERAPHLIPRTAIHKDTSEIERIAHHLPPSDDNDSRLPEGQLPISAPSSSLRDTASIEAASFRKRKSPLKAIAAPQTPAKIPAGKFGMDGTTATPQSTPQSERDMIMARTFSSLFGFSGSPTPLQPFVQTPTLSVGMSGMGRVNNTTGTAELPKQSQKERVSVAAAPADEIGMLPPIDTSEVEQLGRGDRHPRPSQEPSEMRLILQPTGAHDLHEGAVIHAQASNLKRLTIASGLSLAHVSPSKQPDMAEAAPDAQSDCGQDTPAAILEAAIEGDFDVAAESAEAAVHRMPTAPVPASPLLQIEVIDLKSSDEEDESGHITEESQQPPCVESTIATDGISAPAFPGSPTEVDDSDEDGAAGELHDVAASSSQAIAADECEAESFKDPMAGTVSETRQPQDAQSIQPGASEPAKSFFADQMMAVEELHVAVSQPQVPGSQPPKNTHSFHHFTSQSTTTATSSYPVEQLKSDAENQALTGVIQLLSSSPAAEADESYAIDAAVQPTDVEAHAMGDDEEMSHVRLLSPAQSSAEHVNSDGQNPHGEFGSNAEQPLLVVEDDEHMSNADQASDSVGDDDEHMSGGEKFSPVLSGMQVTSLGGLGLVVDTHAAGYSSTDSSSFSHHHPDHRVEATELPSYPALPMSPDDSQINLETQLGPAAPQVSGTALPPTPQLTQGDSLVKETGTFVKTAESALAPFDPPSRHTRSSVEPIVADAAQPTHIAPDPPSRHTRSSAEPTVNGHTRSPDSKTPARRSTRRSQTHGQISEVTEERDPQQEQDGGELIAVLSPLQKTPARKSLRNAFSATTSSGAEVKEAEQSLPKRSPGKASFTSRLSNVPDVISAWFSPRRSTRLHPEEVEEEANTEEVAKQPAFRGLSTAMGYYPPLSVLSQRTNSQARADNTVDVIAIVVDSNENPERAKAGPKDYFTCFKVWDPSLGPDTSVMVEVFRPWKATLPSAEVSDVILLRGFSVKSRKRQPYLISSETSGWCVWRYAEHEGVEGRMGKKRAVSFSGIREEIKGPPVELGEGERDRVGELREVWEKLH